MIKVNIETNKIYQVGYELNPNNRKGCSFWIIDLETKKAVTELVDGVELWRANPITYRPIQNFLEPRPIMSNSYPVPIKVINKMGNN